MLTAHARLVDSALEGKVRIHVIENGEVLRVSADASRVEDRIQLKKRCLGVGLSGDLSDELMSERHRLSTAGIVSPIVFSALIWRVSSCTTTGATPSTGSSSSNSDGLPISVRPMVSICCSPPER
jgi:mRNA degradation ribonuclease J1/J2